LVHSQIVDRLVRKTLEFLNKVYL